MITFSLLQSLSDLRLDVLGWFIDIPKIEAIEEVRRVRSYRLWFE